MPAMARCLSIRAAAAAAAAAALLAITDCGVAAVTSTVGPGLATTAGRSSAAAAAVVRPPTLAEPEGVLAEETDCLGDEKEACASLALEGRSQGQGWEDGGDDREAEFSPPSSSSHSGRRRPHPVCLLLDDNIWAATCFVVGYSVVTRATRKWRC
mmetsp:Transcript_78416/g.196946  ORF Transcript_78416/g.196946 Transcript_78416/m.196946 type:complete len:155 (-) Transcript_78416:107-571(-)